MTVKNTFRSVVAGLVLLGLLAAAGAQRKKQIAVLDFDFNAADLGIASHVFGGRDNLGRRIERSQLERILREQNLANAGRIDANTAAKLGRILGVDALVIGNVSLFEYQGMPKDRYGRDPYWNPRNLRAKIGVNVRMIDTTTAHIELSRELIGLSAQPAAPQTKKQVTGQILTDIFLTNRNNREPKLTDEMLRDTGHLAVDDVVTKISAELEKSFSHTGGEQHQEPEPKTQINGRVISVSGPTVVIVDISRSTVRVGDRLYVRRGRAVKDEVTGRTRKFTERVGEVEIVEIQDEVIMGSFSGSGAAQVGDIITNSASGAGTSSLIQNPRAGEPTPQTPQNPAPGGGGRARERAVNVYANQGWTDNGIDVQPGLTFHFTAEGTINLSPTVRVSAAGETTGRYRALRRPLPGAPAGMLIARVRLRNGQYSNLFPVGTQNSGQAEAGEYGRLELGVNDDSLADNTGAFVVRVRW
jgi:hypothetical protein